MILAPFSERGHHKILRMWKRTPDVMMRGLKWLPDRLEERAWRRSRRQLVPMKKSLGRWP